MKRLINGKISNISRACNLICITISRETEEIEIHIQTFFRLIRKNKILLSYEELFEPADKRKSSSFEWDVPGTSLYDKHLEKHKKDLFSKSVINVIVNEIGDLSIEFEDGYKLQVLKDSMKKTENYRVFIVGREDILLN